VRIGGLPQVADGSTTPQDIAAHSQSPQRTVIAYGEALSLFLLRL